MTIAKENNEMGQTGVKNLLMVLYDLCVCCEGLEVTASCTSGGLARPGMLWHKASTTFVWFLNLEKIKKIKILKVKTVAGGECNDCITNKVLLGKSTVITEWEWFRTLNKYSYAKKALMLLWFYKKKMDDSFH